MFDFLVGNDFISSLLAFGLVLIPAVIVHELGHLLAAKAVGITILEFGVGYPPRAFKLFSWGETIFTFNIIPLGGFVRPFGEDMVRPQSAEEVAKARAELNDAKEAPQDPMEREFQSDRERLLRLGITNPKTINDAKPLGRIFFMAAGAIANVLGALVVFFIVGLTGVQEPTGQSVAVADIAPGSVLIQAGLQPGDLIEGLNGVTIDGRDVLVAALNGSEPVTLDVRRLAADGETIETAQIVIPAGAVSGLEQVADSLVVSDYQADSPAALAGMQPGDIFLSADGQSLQRPDAFEVLREVNEANQGREYTLKVERGGETINLQVTPRVNPGALGYLGAGVQTIREYGTLSLIDGSPIIVTRQLGLGESVQYAFSEVGTVLQMIAQLPARLLSGEASSEESRVVSIVGISQLGGVLLQGSVEEGSLFPFLRFAALISIALGITNLLPIPPLDGGRILFVLIEMVRGKPMSQRLEDAIMMTGVLFMLALGVIFIINDIANPIVDMLR